MALDSEHRPISEAADGASMCLDGGTIIKLGGQIIAAEQAVADIDDRL